MTERKKCRLCGNSLFTDKDKYCPHCGAPQKKPQSAFVKFLLAILSCAGYFAIYFGITFLFELGLEIATIWKTDTLSLDFDAEFTEEVLVGMSEHFCTVGIASAITVLLVYAVIFLARKKKISDEMRLHFVPLRSFSGLLLLGLCAQFAVTVVLTFIYTRVPSAAQYSESDIYELIFKNADPVTEFLYVAVITPLLEETLFRGLIYTRLKKVIPVSGAIILSAVIFGAAHGNLEQFIYAFLLGVLMAAVFEKYDSLWASFAIHFAFNAGSSLVQLMPEDDTAAILAFLISTGVFLLISAVMFFTKTINTSGAAGEESLHSEYSE